MDQVLSKISSSIPKESLHSLYKSLPESTLFIYRLASPMGKILICRMLFLPIISISLAQVKKWPSSEEENPLLYESLVLFKKLGILEGHQNEIWLNPIFCQSLQSVFEKGISCSNSPPKDKDLKSDEFEKILLFLFNQSNPVPSIVSSLLSRAGLYIPGQGITQRGFQFALQDRADQLWTLLSQDIDQSFLEQLISFLFPPPFLNHHQKIKGKSSKISPYPLFQSLGLEHSINSLFISTVPESNGFIVVETNYKIYAYTASPLHIEILKLFCCLKGSFPNLQYGFMSAETLKQAFSRGIEADQIIAYIKKHLHPKCQSLGVPSNLIDQIKLWEMEKYRLKRENVVAYSDFPASGAGTFEAVVQAAENLGGLLLWNAQKKIILVKPEIHERLKRLLKSS